MATATDSFTRADSGSLGANWTAQSANAFGISSNQAAPQGGFNVHAQYWSADTFSGDQYSEATISGLGGSSYVGVAVRCATGAVTNYGLWVNPGGDSIIRYTVGGADTTILTMSSSAFANGDVARLEVSGTTLTAKKNGAVVGTITHSSLSSGSPGMVAYGSAARLDNWTGSDIDTTVYDPITACFPIGYYE